MLHSPLLYHGGRHLSIPDPSENDVRGPCPDPPLFLTPLSPLLPVKTLRRVVLAVPPLLERALGGLSLCRVPVRWLPGLPTRLQDLVAQLHPAQTEGGI